MTTDSASTTLVNHRTVLDATPAAGATLTQIAEAMHAPAAQVQGVLTSLLVRGLVFKRWPFQARPQWVPTAQAARMTSASNEELRQHIPSRLAGGSR